MKTAAFPPAARRRCCRVLPMALGCVLLCTTARAQSVFVQGAYGPDVRRFSGDDSDRVFDARTASLAITAGGFIARHLTVAVEIDVGAESTESRTANLTIAGRPATITTEYSLRRRTVAALAGVHTSATRRARFGVYAGLGFNAVRRAIAADAPPIVLSDPPAPSVFVDRTADLVAGADAVVRVAPRVAVLGSIRAGGLSLSGDLRGFSIRPRGGVRLSF